MAGLPPDIFYLVQRNEMLAAENQRQAGSIRALVDQERHLREEVGGYRRQLAEKEAERRGVQQEVERLRAQLLETQQQVQELEGRREDQPRRKKAKGRPGEFVPSVRLNNTAAPWSTLSPSSLREKKAALRNGYLEPCFSRLPQNVVKAKVNFRTEDGFCVEVDWPQGLNDRRGRPPPAEHIPVTGRGYRHQTDETRDLVRWCVYFKDQASVSDVWWHELHMKFPKIIPPISWIREERGQQNSFLPYQLEENARDGNGASRSVKDILRHHLLMPENQHLLEEDEPVVNFRYGLDGRPQAKNTVIGAVMACITPVRDIEEAKKRPRSVRDEYCVFVYSGKEDYEEQVQSGSRVFREMEELQQHGFNLTVGEDEDGQERTKHIRINWYIVSDWKALAEMLGLVGPTGNYFCVLCYCNKEHVSRFSEAFPLRTHDKAARYVQDRKDNKGHLKLPVLTIKWENTIIDTLHMYLRIGGKLLTQLIGWVIDQDVPDKLENAMMEVGIRTFYLKKEATKQGPSTYKWKTLSAKELKKTIKLLPDKMPAIIKNVGSASEKKIDSLSGPQLRSILQSKGERVPRLISERKALLKNILGSEMVTLPGRESDEGVEIRVEQIQELWREFDRIMNMPRNPELHASYKTAARKWAENFRDITYIEDCTPYIHYFGCHAGDQLQAHPFLHYVNCETIEKKNHVQTRRYHLATQKGGGRNPSKWAEQLMQMENRETFAAVHGIGQREKRKWTKRTRVPEDPGYGGGSASESDPEELAGVRDTDDEDDADDRIVYDGDQDD